jgi:hypothetical protein
MYGKCYHVSRMQLRRTQSVAEYAERFPERHHPGPRQLLICISIQGVFEVEAFLVTRGTYS